MPPGPARFVSLVNAWFLVAERSWNLSPKSIYLARIDSNR